jgi:hypothetical protein
MLADFDERAGRYAAAVEKLDEAVGMSDELGMRGLAGPLLSRLAWSLLQDGDTTRAEAMIGRALDLGRRLELPAVLFLAYTGSALVHRHHRRDDEAVTAAVEALRLHQQSPPRRFSNRIDPDRELLSTKAACCVVLGAIAIERGEADKGAQLLGHAARLRERCGSEIPAFQRDEIARATALAEQTLHPDGLIAAFEQGRRADLADLLADLLAG